MSTSDPNANPGANAGFVRTQMARDRLTFLDDEELALWRADAERVALIDPAVAAVWIEEADRELAIRRRAHYTRAPLPTRGGVPRETIDAIKRATDLPRLLEHFGLRLRRAGDHWVALCPFHQERTPSFHVWPDHAKCFGCGIYVDAIAVVDFYIGCGFLPALDTLADLAGMEYPSEALERRQRAGRGAPRAPRGQPTSTSTGTTSKTRIVDGKVVSE